METIRSVKNPAIRLARAVEAGRKPGRILLEGPRLVRDAVRGGAEIELALVGADRDDLAAELAGAGLVVLRVEPGLLARVGALAGTSGVLAVAGEPPPPRADVLEPCPGARVVVAAGVQDPGNLGALARCAEAFGARALAVVAGGCSPWNPKALRGSMGSLLRLPVVRCDDAATLASDLARRGWRAVRAATRGGADARAFDWSGPIALWLTGESGAFDVPSAGFEDVTIALRPGVESLNVTAAAAILLHAAAGQASAAAGGAA